MSALSAASTATSTSVVGRMWSRNRSLQFPENRLTDEETKGLAALKVYLKENPLQPPAAINRFDDFDLAKFVVIAKCNVKKCRSRMQKFVECTALYKVDEVALEDVKEFLNQLPVVSYAPTLDKEGRYSLFNDVGGYLPSDIKPERKFQLMVKVFFTTMDLVTDTIAATRKGITVQYDMREFGWKNFDRELERKKTKVFQNCYPVKFARLHMINPPWYMNAIMGIVKLFLKKKIASRMKCVWMEKNVSKNKMLSTYVERHQLPPSMGGTLTELFQTWMVTKMGFGPKKACVDANANASSLIGMCVK